MDVHKMPIESTDDGVNGEYFEVLHILIPRYLRVIGDGSKENRPQERESSSLIEKYPGRLRKSADLNHFTE